MSIERIYHCDWRECDGHEQTAASRIPLGIIAVREGRTGKSLHFCKWDCVLHFAAQMDPTEVIPFHDEPEGEAEC